ncbi:uncharacterized protein F5891DRAFT_1199606 [Suillus fuscotomentosus]|uniref:Uncharacterized protein n=1 Tax=Suillus fuscotomentosus TaxID=1912939 RepID=A0AAD4DP82_9AGAM|nr:uncharacterized protein F5891DRAFT_1199606 [Suillus fuscotomentosus]KAG1887557.1 hypothetical protein F5891DRAFT_1199606 [Suillus fuscotomentosus]
MARTPRTRHTRIAASPHKQQPKNKRKPRQRPITQVPPSAVCRGTRAQVRARSNLNLERLQNKRHLEESLKETILYMDDRIEKKQIELAQTWIARGQTDAELAQTQAKVARKQAQLDRQKAKLAHQQAELALQEAELARQEAILDKLKALRHVSEPTRLKDSTNTVHTLETKTSASSQQDSTELDEEHKTSTRTETNIIVDDTTNLSTSPIITPTSRTLLP